MSKEERFEVMMNEETGKWCIKDNEQLPSLLDNYKACVRLNEFAEKVKGLQSQLAITEKALELASETIKQMCGKPLWIGGNISSLEPKNSEYFKDIAKEMLENE